MANSIVLKAKSISKLDEYVAFSAALALNNGTMDIPATFSITSAEDPMPMIGITEYGKLVGLYSTADVPSITIKATGPDGAVKTFNGTPVQILDTNPGAALGGGMS